MLDDAERRRLAEIESWFEANDPRLTRRLAGPGARRMTIAVVITLAAMTLAIIAGWTVFGAPAGIEGGLIVAAVAAGWWLQRRGAKGPRPPVAS